MQKTKEWSKEVKTICWVILILTLIGTIFLIILLIRIFAKFFSGGFMYI